MPRLFLVLIAVLAFTGCKFDSPHFDSGSVEVRRDGRVARGELGDWQIKGLRDWLQARPTGWTHRVETSTADVVLWLRREGRQTAYVELAPRQVRVGRYVRALTAEESSQLHLIVTTFLTLR